MIRTNNCITFLGSKGTESNSKWYLTPRSVLTLLDHTNCYLTFDWETQSASTWESVSKEQLVQNKALWRSQAVKLGRKSSGLWQRIHLNKTVFPFSPPSGSDDNLILTKFSCVLHLSFLISFFLTYFISLPNNNAFLSSWPFHCLPGLEMFPKQHSSPRQLIFSLCEITNSFLLIWQGALPGWQSSMSRMKWQIKKEMGGSGKQKNS